MKNKFHNPIKYGFGMSDSSTRQQVMERDQLPECEPTEDSDRSKWEDRMSDLFEDQQRRDKIMREGREAALKLRRSILTGCITKEIKLP